LKGHFIITEFDVVTGEPLGPYASKYRYHCGFLVRDKLPISAREWKKKIHAPHISYVSDVDKEALWSDIKEHFTFDTERYHDGDIITHERLVELVRHWTMKKMATQFQTWKKELFNKYVSNDETPDWRVVKGPLAKQRPCWEEFVQYKTSEEGMARARRNQENSHKKQYHHNMGSGGYLTAVQKWERAEAKLREKGIEPESDKWPERTRRWYLAHGGSLDPLTGKMVHGKKLEEATTKLIQILKAKASGLFRPNREKDELTYILGTDEHPGRTRGFGAVTWEHGFPQWRDTYRSRQRKKDEEAEKLHILQQYVLDAKRREEEMEARMQEEVKRQVQIAMSSQGLTIAPGTNILSPANQTLRSSCASTELPKQDERFPVDDIDKLTACELHIPNDDGTVMVATGVVGPIDRTKTPRIHGVVIPAGYASVSVDKAVRGFEDVPLDIPGGDGSATVGEAEKSFIAWRKRYIIIPGMPSPPPQVPNHRYA
jgi:hypothetical protein